ncbi:F0F1 ATP synthase subunit A [Oceanivirga miroungae]|nr:F0F1 ATP synthase subunit A [Oceanivirga miroungae]
MIFIGVTILVNGILALISTYLPISFLKPKDIIEGPKIFAKFNLLGINIYINQTILNTWILMLLMIVILYLGTRKLSVEKPGVMQLILEELYNFIDEQFLANFKNYKKTFMPLFSALFSFLLLANLSSFLFPFIWMKETHGNITKIVPFFRTPTADINTTVGLALIVTITFIGCGIYKNGVIGIIRDLSKPFVLMFPINLIGELAKPINISMRLFGNMFAGIVIVGLLYGISLNNILSSWTGNMLNGSFSFAVMWPGFLQLYLDLFIGALQAFVFTVLSSVYVQQALLGDEDDEN